MSGYLLNALSDEEVVVLYAFLKESRVKELEMEKVANLVYPYLLRGEHTLRLLRKPPSIDVPHSPEVIRDAVSRDLFPYKDRIADEAILPWRIDSLRGDELKYFTARIERLLFNGSLSFLLWRYAVKDEDIQWTLRGSSNATLDDRKSDVYNSFVCKDSSDPVASNLLSILRTLPPDELFWEVKMIVWHARCRSDARSKVREILPAVSHSTMVREVLQRAHTPDDLRLALFHCLRITQWIDPAAGPALTSVCQLDGDLLMVFADEFRRQFEADASR